jgi:hypothetical protein
MTHLFVMTHLKKNWLMITLGLLVILSLLVPVFAAGQHTSDTLAQNPPDRPPPPVEEEPSEEVNKPETPRRTIPIKDATLAGEWKGINENRYIYLKFSQHNKVVICDIGVYCSDVGARYTGHYELDEENNTLHLKLMAPALPEGPFIMDAHEFEGVFTLAMESLDLMVAPTDNAYIPGRKLTLTQLSGDDLFFETDIFILFQDEIGPVFS